MLLKYEHLSIILMDGNLLYYSRWAKKVVYIYMVVYVSKHDKCRDIRGIFITFGQEYIVLRISGSRVCEPRLGGGFKNR